MVHQSRRWREARGRGGRAAGATLRASRPGRIPALALAGALALSAPAPTAAQAADRDSTPHSDARLIAGIASIRPGEPFTVGLHITLDPGWHTYWKNAGDAGTGVIPAWQLPAGFTVDSLRYPRPERIPYPPLMNYGYNDEVVVLAEVTPPPDLEPGRTVELALDAEWLVCEEICIPARDRVSLELPVRDAAPAPSPDASLIDRYREELPIESADWAVRAARTDSGFVLAARPPADWDGSLRGAYFFPADPVLLDHTAPQPVGLADGEGRLRLEPSPYLADEPGTIEGILVLPEGAAFDDAGHRALEVRAAVLTGGAAAWAAEPVTPLAPAQLGGGAGPAGGLTLLAALAFAFLGGLLLNLMPCVFPILSLKALGFATRGGDRRGMRLDGLAFAAGVVVSFLVVAAVLLAVRASGAEVGWGYQLQSPGLVAALAALMFGIGLVLAGVVEVGTSLTRLGGIGARGGYGGAFLTGVLATVVATPCTAPFMGAAIGAALVRPPVEGLAVFAGLGLGMATPYVALAFWPALAHRLPRPGRWMETFQQALAFPMFAVAIWLVWVFGLQVGVGGAARLLFGLLLLAMAAWVVGRWPAPALSRRARWATRGVALALLVLAVLAGVAATEAPPGTPSAPATDPVEAAEWEPFSMEAIAGHRAAGRPVFVDFTAAWCISCKVNERVALGTEPVRRAFAARNVVLMKADWTRRDPAITRALASFGRSGVPLYVLYPADPAAEPHILPALLTPGMVLDALDALPEPTGERRQARAEPEPNGGSP